MPLRDATFCCQAALTKCRAVAAIFDALFSLLLKPRVKRYIAIYIWFIGDNFAPRKSAYKLFALRRNLLRHFYLLYRARVRIS